MRNFYSLKKKRLLLQDKVQTGCLTYDFKKPQNLRSEEMSLFSSRYYIFLGQGSVVGTATGYGLDDPGIESRWVGEIFRTCPDRPWGPPSLLYNGYWVFPGAKERPERDANPSPPSSAVGHEGVELYLYSP